MVDEKDYKIIKELVKNARRSSRELSKKTKLSHQTVLTRLKKIEENNIIRRYSAIVDWDQIGLPIKTITVVETGNARKGDLDQIHDYLNKTPNILFSGMISGEYDLFFVQAFKNEEDAALKNLELRNFLSEHLDVHRFRTHTLWNVIKGDLALPHELMD